MKKLSRLLNLGSGNRPGKTEDGWINLDIDKGCNPDIVRDLNTCLPFDDNSVDQVRASHVIEHINDVFYFMYEIWRVSKPNTMVEIIAPNHAHLMSIYPNHKRFVRPQYFDMWNPNWDNINAAQNARQETFGATFICHNESIIENSGSIRFTLQVIKEPKKKTKGKVALNLGCGLPKHKDEKVNILNIDIDSFNEPDVLADLEKGLPFDDNSIDQIYSAHFLEHIDPDKIDFFMYECWRVLKKGKKFKCIVPIGKSWASSPYHKAPMSEHTPVFFTNWNNPDKTGYNYKLKSRKIIKGLDDGKEVDYFDELHFVLEVVK